MEVHVLVCAVFFTVAYSLPANFLENVSRKEYTPEDMRLIKAILADEQSNSPNPLLEKDLSDGTEDCVDEHDSETCAFYATKYPEYCDGHEEFMSTYCRATCGFCNKKAPSPVKECKDLRASCSFFATQFKGYCDYNNGFMTLNCAKSCQFCKQKFPSPPVPEKGEITAYWSARPWDQSCMSKKRYRTVLCVHNEGGVEVPVKEEWCALQEDKPEEIEICE